MLYLVAAGVGTIRIVDDDVVDLSNLQRQVAHSTGRIGMPKVGSVADAATALNPLTVIEPRRTRLQASNAAALLADCDVVCDASDTLSTRYLLSDACQLAGKPLVSAAAIRFDGQLTLFPPGGPCFRCLHPAPPAALPTCGEAGVLGAVTGVMGSLQATEVLKHILGIGDSLAGRLLLWDALGMRFHIVGLPRDPACPACGEHPTIHDLSAHG